MPTASAATWLGLLLYGGRASLQIGIASALICCVVATVVALIAGFFGGMTDAILSRIMDVIWAFPVILLAICISTELLTHSNGLHVGPFTIRASSLWVPTLIIAGIYVPYVYRPVRGQVLSVREQGVRRGGDRAGRLELPADLLRDPAERACRPSSCCCR